MLGSTRVDTALYNIAPQGKNNSKTMFSLGALCLFLFFGIFFYGVHLEANNKKNHTQWTEVDKKSHAEFRPKRLHMAYDVFSLGLGIAGLAFFVGGGLRFRKRDNQHFSLGTDNASNMTGLNEGGESFRLVERTEAGIAINIKDTWDFEIQTPTELINKTQGQHAKFLKPHPTLKNVFQMVPPSFHQCTLAKGDQRIEMVPLSSPKALAKPVINLFDSSFAKSLSGTALATLALLFLLSTILPSSQALALDESFPFTRIADLKSLANEPPIAQSGQRDSGQGRQITEHSNGTIGQEGDIGIQTSMKLVTRLKIKKQHATHPQKISTSMEPILRNGILSSLTQKDNFRSMLSSTELMNGFDDEARMGNRSLGETGDPMGHEGLGFIGIGSGGDSKTPGTIGVGDIGNNIGTHFGNDAYNGPARGRSQQGGSKANRLPHVTLKNLTADPGLDKGIIRRYVREKLSRIRYCYESNLVVEKDLAGTVVAWFQINPQGKVLGSKASGIGNKAVEACVSNTIQSITFPAPKNGSMVTVKYPFHMASASP